jgi:hypothetical protein
MNKVYRWALRYQAAISMVLALFVFALFSMWQPARAAELPDSLTFQQQMFGLICGTPEDLRIELLNTHGEVPVVAGLLDGGTQWIMYVSEDKNTMSFVIHKSDEEACLVWSGASELGQAFMLNPNPDFPVEETSNKDWNT